MQFGTGKHRLIFKKKNENSLVESEVKNLGNNKKLELTVVQDPLT